jgi:CubicO group peptidase (beta-lactamase class C family)
MRRAKPTTRRAEATGQSWIDRVDELVSAEIASANTPGAVVFVGHRGRRLLQRAWGAAALVPARRPMHIDTIFDLASLTKCLSTALLVMQLVDRGRLALRDRASRFVRDFTGGGKEDLTLLDLSTHTSGLVDTRLYDPRRPMRNKTPDVWRAICGAKVVAPPGTSYRYQDINFIVLGKVVEAVLGTSIDRAFHRLIAVPLALRDAQYCPAKRLRARIAPTERVDGELLLGLVHDPRARALDGTAGNSGLFATARDVARIAQTVLDDGLGSHPGPRLLSVATAQSMVRVHTAPGVAPRAIGWDTDAAGTGPRGDLFSRDGFGHTGFTGTSVWVDRPSRTVVVLLTNRLHPSGRGDVIGLRRRLANVVASGLVQ